MTRKSGDRPLDELERRFQALRDQVGALPEAGRSGVATALQEVSQAIAALRADRQTGESPAAEAPDCPAAADSPAPADAILRHVFSAIPDMLTVIDRDFNIIMTNWHESGMVPEEARQGQPKCHRVFHHRDRPCKACHVHKVFATGQPQKTEETNLLDGRTREFSAFPVLSKSGQVILVAEHARDITERNQAARALKESEERFRAIFEAAQDAIFIKDRSLHYTQVNPAMERLFDRPAADLIGKTDKDLFGAEAEAQIRAADQRVLNGEVLTEVSTRLVRGESKAFHVVKAPLHDDAGQVVGLCGIARDITDLKRTEEALKESEEWFKLLFAVAPDAYFLMNLQGNFLDVNLATEEISGYSREELIGINYHDLPLLDEQQKSLAATLFQQAMDGKTIGPAELILNHCDGRQVVIEAKGLMVQRKGESLLLGIARDITARKRADEELVKNHQELQDAAQRLEQSRNMLQLVLESIPVRVFWKDADLRYLGCNTLFARDAGLDHPEQLLGQDDFAMGWREQAELYRMDDRQVMESLRPKIDLVEPQTTPDGGKIWLKTSKVPLQMPNGEVFGVLGVYDDITAQKQAEEALEKREVTLRTLIEANPESLFLLDTRGVILAASKVAAQRLGKSLEEIIGTDLHDMLPYEVSKKRFEIMQGVAATGQAARFEDIRGNFYFDNSITPIFDQDKVVQIAVLGVDISLRKQAEQALRESEELFRHISSTISDISYSYTAGPDGSYAIDWLAGAVERITGYSAEEILAQGCWEFLIIEADHPRFEKNIIGLAAGTSGTCELRLRHQNGGIVWVASFAKIVQEPDQPELLHIYGGLVDITARKQAEAALAAHLQFLQLLLDTIPNPIFFKDAQGAYLGCNKAFENYFGVTRKEIIGKSVYDLSPKELADEYHRMDLEAFQTTGIQVYESRVQAADGAWRHVVFHKATFPDPTGGLGGLVGMITDITGLKQTEMDLRKSEQRFRLMAETIQDVFWIATPTLDRVIYANPAYEQVWGHSRQDLYEHPQLFVECIHPEDRDRALAEITAAQEQGSPSDHAYRIIKPDGAVRWIHDRGFPIPDDQGRVIMYTGVATDITERKVLEQQLLQAQKMEAVGRLAGGIAHDFNNLLMAITGYSELMRSKVLKDDPLYSHLENILKAGDRATALTQQLLTFSRQKIVHPQVVDLNRVVLDLEPMLRRLIGEDLDLEVVTDGGTGAVKADPGQLGQIVMNLVVNARDAMPQGGRLTLKTAPVDFTVVCHNRFGLTPPGAYVRLEVQDTGMGMDEATQAHVFEPFFTTKDPGKGTGLGLSTVYGIVKQSDGYLDLVSSPGAGSTFTVYLPRLDQVVGPSKAKIPITASFRGEETILLVEDEDVLRGLLAKFLRLYGYTVLEARHGGEALLTCERHPGPIHLMVTDVVMPQMSGRELADRLTPLRPEMKIIYISGYTEDALVQHGVADLSVAFLQKPFKPIELARQVRAVLHPPVSR